MLWFAAYRVAFHGDYVFQTSTPSDHVTIKLVFPAPDVNYDDLVVRADGKPLPLATKNGAVSGVMPHPSGAPIHLDVGYRIARA